MRQASPPLIDGMKTLEYAFTNEGVEFTDRIGLYVGGADQGGLERVVEVACLAICSEYRTPKEALLCFCDEHRETKGVIVCSSVDEAKLQAERGYRGISEAWQLASYSEEQTNNYLRDVYQVDPNTEWWKTVCPFCGKDDSEVGEIFTSLRATICKGCVIKLHESLSDTF